MFSHPLRLGRVFGIEIELDYSWFIIFGLVAISMSGALKSSLIGLPAGAYWLLGILVALVLFASVLLHELAHSLIARREGLEISGITLFLFGGVSKLSKEPISARSELLIAVAGPATSLILGGGFQLLGKLSPFPAAGVILQTLGAINLMLAVFNLIPGFPLDGGRVLRAIIWQITGNFSRATRIAALSGQGFGLLFIFLGIVSFFTNPSQGLGGLWIAFIGWFLIQAAQNSYQQVILKRLLSGLPVRSLMQPEVITVEAGLSLEDLVNHYFLTHNYTAFPVMRGGEIVGLIHLADIRKVPRENWGGIAVGEIVSPLGAAQIIAPEADAWEALEKMAADGEGRLLVIDRGQLAGILSRSDLMRLIRTKMQLGA
jgi:Zn-dependent protease/CBS domain-containing protein